MFPPALRRPHAVALRATTQLYGKMSQSSGGSGMLALTHSQTRKENTLNDSERERCCVERFL